MKWLKEGLPYVAIIVVVILIRTFIITPVRVSGSSMDNTLKNGDIVVLKKMDKVYKRFDIIVFNYNNERLIKRVIGLPGETIKYQNNKLYINGNIIDDYNNLTSTDFDLQYYGYSKIPDGYYFVMGDNRDVSLDSRKIGLISKNVILGTVSFRLYPFNKFGSV